MKISHKKSSRTYSLFFRKDFLLWIAFPILLIGFLCWLRTEVGYAINMTDSLPQKLFLVRFNQRPKVGDFIVFKAPNSVNPSNELTLTKQVKGKGGDTVTRQNRDFYVDGQWVGKAKAHSLKGEPLEVGPVGVIPEGQYYVATEHKDSFDSRYKEMGWVSHSQCLGVAYPLW